MTPGPAGPDQSAGPGHGSDSLNDRAGRLHGVLSVDPGEVEQIDLVTGFRHQVGLNSSAGPEEGHAESSISKLVGYGEGWHYVPRRTAGRYHDVCHRMSFGLLVLFRLHRRSGAVLHPVPVPGL